MREALLDIGLTVGKQKFSLLLVLQGTLSIVVTILVALWLGRLIESRLVRNRSELAAALTRFDRVRLFDVAGLPRRTRLLVKGRAEMGTRTLLSFIPILLNTEWADSRKFRVP